MIRKTSENPKKDEVVVEDETEGAIEDDRKHVNRPPCLKAII